MLDARTIPSLVAAGLAALMLSLSAAEAFAVSASSPCTRWAASQLDPYDLNVMRSSVSRFFAVGGGHQAALDG